MAFNNGDDNIVTHWLPEFNKKPRFIAINDTLMEALKADSDANNVPFVDPRDHFGVRSGISDGTRFITVEKLREKPRPGYAESGDGDDGTAPDTTAAGTGTGTGTAAAADDDDDDDNDDGNIRDDNVGDYKDEGTGNAAAAAAVSVDKPTRQTDGDAKMALQNLIGVEATDGLRSFSDGAERILYAVNALWSHQTGGVAGAVISIESLENLMLAGSSLNLFGIGDLVEAYSSCGIDYGKIRLEQAAALEEFLVVHCTVDGAKRRRILKALETTWELECYSGLDLLAVSS